RGPREVLFVRAQDFLDPPNEHSGIPVVAAGCDHALRGVALGLLHETLYGAYLDGRLDLKLVPRLDVAEAGVRALRGDAERHEVTAVGCSGRGDEHLSELAPIADDVVRR